MSRRIEDYALIGNLHTAALVGRDGSIDWLCVPRFDSPACFAALLGGPEQGHWLIAPEGEIKAVHRTYCDETLILETVYATADGVVALTDFMPIDEDLGRVEVIRLVEGRKGTVPMHMELVLRFDYGEIVPWINHPESGLRAIGGPDAVLIRAPVEIHGHDLKSTSRFRVSKGDTIPFTLIRNDSWLPLPQVGDPMRLRDACLAWWKKWVSRCTYGGPYRKAVIRYLITLKALTLVSTGAVAAARTTSLPEQLGGALNWDYRYCWLRDATFTLCALLVSGYTEEAVAWRAWLLRAVAGQSHKLQIMYGLAGERRLKEFELAHLPGYEGSRPVRIGNAAHQQFQLDVYGEILNALHIAHRYQIRIDGDAWRMQCVFLDSLEEAWQRPDHGMWEVRGGARHFTESKVAAWVTFDRAIKLVETHGMKGPLEKWRAIRARIHRDVCENGFDRQRHTFVQSYGANELDAALLRLPLIGFLPANDPRIVGTVEAIQRELMSHRLVKRYRQAMGGGSEGAFLPCSFWLVDCLVAMGHHHEAHNLYERLVGLCNDVGLLSEEYDPATGRMLGNFPQALTHIGLINSAFNLFHPQKPLNVARSE
jgi:GH15 family glucan-1,4-alpha-glucosidase